MKYYMASDDKNKKQVRSLVKKLKAKGLYCVNEWNVLHQSTDTKREKEIDYFDETVMDAADFVLVFLTAGKGNLYNIGYALALHKKIIVYSSKKDHYHIGKNSIFYHLPTVSICNGTFYKLEKTIRSLAIEHEEKKRFHLYNEKMIQPSSISS